MRFKPFAVLILPALIACGGSHSSAPVAAGSSSGSMHAGTMAPSGEPGWVNRGSAAVSGDGGRVFYGVGSAGGIKNPALLRGAADNRARAELGKVFETFSASLMKDYSASDNVQNVEQAVKTMSSLSLQGVDIVDRYNAADGTLYSLAALDLAKMGPALQQAKAQGLVKSDVKPVTLDDMFDKQATKEAPPAAMVAQADPGAAAAAPVSHDSARVRSGEKPAWVDGADSSFPNAVYLCAVGLANDRNAAENAGYAALSRIFSAQVQSSSKDFLGAYSKTGAPDLQVQSTEALTQVTTQNVLQGVKVLEVWADPKGATYALACLDRATASAALQDQIHGADQEAGGFIDRAAKMDKTGRIGELTHAMDKLLAREALNNQLRIVSVQGVGVPSTYIPGDVSAALEAAVDALKVGVRTSGPFDSDFRTALIQGLASHGYKVTDLASEPETGMDVLVSATIRVEDAGSGSGSAAAMVFARSVIAVEVKNVASNKILAAFNESRKEGSRSQEEAQRRAVRNLATTVTTKVGGQIDATMRGGSN